MSANDLPVKPRANVLLTELPDGTGVLLDLDSKFYFNLNSTGLAMWKALEHAQPKGLAPGELAQLLHEQFDVTLSDASADVDRFCRELADEGLIERSAGDAP